MVRGVAGAGRAINCAWNGWIPRVRFPPRRIMASCRTRASYASPRSFPSRASRRRSQPGNWTVRAVANGTVAFSRTFTIAADVDNGGPVVTSVTWSGEAANAQEIDFTVRGKNFQPGALVLIASTSRRADGLIWPACSRATRQRINSPSTTRGCRPTNIWVIVESPDQAHEPARRSFLIEPAATSCPPRRACRG